MPQSYGAIYIHYVWSTKGRTPMIPEPLHDELHRYIAGIAENKKCKLLCAGGTENHIHLLTSIGREIDVATFSNVIKSNSSHWLRGQIGDTFHWQDGYGAFSVGASNLGAVKKYLLNQKEHHRVVTFEEEFEWFLKEYGIEWDPKWLWKD